MDQVEKKRPGMVDWYAPLKLLATGARTLVSVMLGERIDTRLLSANGEDKESIFDYSDRNSITFDYTADTGDGWDPTFTLAYWMSKPESHDGVLKRSDILILGGDEVYPVASRTAYAQRLIDPYEKAAHQLGQDEVNTPREDMFLIPGNHDWYDSLASFNRRFCSNRWVGSYKTKQKRSYFILKLPSKWHIWATDIQLGKDIDTTQFQFFKKYTETENFGSDDKVILLTAEPGVVYGREAHSELLKTLKALEHIVEVKGAQVPLRIAGDVHNYQHYDREKKPNQEAWENQNPYTQIQLVSGGGGAFLHPTHAFESNPAEAGGFDLKNRYPDTEISKKLSLKNRWFAFNHLPMTSFFGLFFMLMFWPLSGDVTIANDFPVEHPVIFALVLLVILSTTLFSKADLPKSGSEQRFKNAEKAQRWKYVALGVSHGVGLVLIGYIAWKLGHWFGALLSLDPASTLGIYMPRVFDFLIAGFGAATLFGWYLTLSLNLFGIHRNEAFSALAHPHHKHFLRSRIDENGDLRIRVLSLDKTAGEKSQGTVNLRELEEIRIPGATNLSKR